MLEDLRRPGIQGKFCVPQALKQQYCPCLAVKGVEDGPGHPERSFDNAEHIAYSLDVRISQNALEMYMTNSHLRGWLQYRSSLRPRNRPFGRSRYIGGEGEARVSRGFWRALHYLNHKLEDILKGQVPQITEQPFAHFSIASTASRGGKVASPTCG
jgi:hypothetical protein